MNASTGVPADNIADDETDSFETFKDGSRLYGDDLSLEQIQEWFDDEAEGYASLLDKSAKEYEYHYHALNKLLGFRFVPSGSWRRVLGLGSAFGHEFHPIIDRIGEIAIVEPSERFLDCNDILGVPCSYVRPEADGTLPFDDQVFDLATCFGVLHHIPNVSHVVRELGRVTAPGGHVLIREPLVSMGDWTRHREGLTKHERGIPRRLFRQIIEDAGFQVIRESVFGFPPLCRVWIRLTRGSIYNRKLPTKIDALLAKLWAWNYSYHAESLFQKLRPSSAYYVLERPR